MPPASLCSRLPSYLSVRNEIRSCKQKHLRSLTLHLKVFFDDNLPVC